jgi:hypothetical protein
MIEKIYDLIEAMEVELEGAEKYARKAFECAMHKRHSDASSYASMAEEELRHYEKLDAMLKEHYDALEGDMKHYIDHKRGHLMRELSEVKYMISKANEK